MFRNLLLHRKERNSRPWCLHSLIVAAAAFLLTWCGTGCEQSGKKVEAAKTVEAKPVKVVKAEPGNLQPAISITGTIIPLQEVDIFSKIPGRVESVAVKEGDRVNEGDLLVQLEEDEYAAQLRQVEANLAQAKTNLDKARTGYELQDTQVAVGIGQAIQGKLQATFSSDQAQLQLDNIRIDRDRMRRLFDRGAISKQQLETYELRYDTAKKQYETTLSMIRQANESVKLARANSAMKSLKRDDISLAQAQISALQASADLARITLKNCRIVAPITGFVTFKNVDRGEIVSAMAAGMPLVRLVDNSVVHLDCDLNEDRLEYVHENDPVHVTMDAYVNKVFKGTIDTIIPSADLKTRAFKVKISIPNGDGLLKSGMFGRASILRPALAGLIIPRPSLVRVEAADEIPVSIPGSSTAKGTNPTQGAKERYYVFVNEGNRAKKHEVTIGTLTETRALVTKGLGKDAEIIYLGQENLQENDPISVLRGK